MGSGLEVVERRKVNSVIDGGKLQPQAPDLEEAVLGAMMLEKNAVIIGLSNLKVESFYRESHQHIFKAIEALYRDNSPVDILTVTNELKAEGKLDLVGGPYYLSQLTNKIASGANVEFHARIIAQAALKRGLIRIATDAIKDGYDETEDAFDACDRLAVAHSNLMSGITSSSIQHVSSKINEVNQAIDNGFKQNGITGVVSGLRDLDKLTGGWQKSDLIIIAARPAMGKTAFALSIARNAAETENVIFFSKEMSNFQLTKRLVASEAEINSDKLYKGGATQEELHQKNLAVAKIEKLKLFIDDNTNMSVQDIKTTAIRYKAEHGLGLVVVDYLQILNALDSKGKNREQQINEIAIGLKNVARILDVPVIVLSQLNRSVETRGGDKRPMLSDLRESGAIEQEADVVAFIHRPEYYGMTTYENGDSAIGIGEIIIAKHRNGSLDSVKTTYMSYCTKFKDLDRYSFVPDAGEKEYNPNAHLEPNRDFEDNEPF